MTTDGSTPGGTALDWLTRHARLRPDATAVAVWRDGAIRETYDFAGLSALVGRAAAAMSRHAPHRGDRVVLALPNDVTFTAALLACTAAGLIAVPAPALTAGTAPAALVRLRGIVADCGPSLVVGCAGQAPGWADAPIAGIGRVTPWDDLIASAEPPVRPRDPAGHHATALLQYTSGSTGSPKGAVISHRAIRASCAQAARAYQETSRDTAVTWVPLHHDMGLITGVLRPLFSGYTSVLLRPRDFARAPLSWLRALAATRGTLSSAPDFAYGLCVRKVTPEQVRGLDLSSWRVARNAGEVVRTDTADRFTGCFAPAGFRARAFCPSYGMAEATLTVTTSTPDDPPLVLAVDRAALRAGRVVPAPSTGGPERPRAVLLSSGRPLPGTEVAIDVPHVPDTRAVPGSGTVGRVRIRGPQLFSGYWHASHAPGGSAEDWHTTGDVGFVHQGHLFVLGRGDDTVVQNGRNFYAADIRAVCAGVSGLRPGRSVAFAAGGPGPTGSAATRVRLVAEADAKAARPRAELAREVRQRLATDLGLYVHDVELLAPGEMPVTTSGKPEVTEIRARHGGRTHGPRPPDGDRA